MLVYILLVCSFATFVNAQDNDQTIPNECSFNGASTNQCVHYVKGYLNALQKINNVGQNSNFSEFEKRAFKTRVGNTSLTAILQKELNLCLPKEISASEMLDSIDPSLPTEKAMLKALQDQKKRLC